jgi:beta-glucosidase
MEAWPRLPAGFQFGVATRRTRLKAGSTPTAVAARSGTPFSHTPGRTRDGDTGDVACDFYPRYPPAAG